jgi:transposase-like protein
MPAMPPAGWSVPTIDRGMRLADPTALAALVTPELPLAQVSDALCWLTFLLTRCYGNVPLSVFGRWCGVHKTTILRGVLGRARALWPLIDRWIGERVNASMVSVDEQWLKLQGRWHYWFVVLDLPTELPVLAVLLPSRRQGACRWVGRQWGQRNKVPKVLSTDGLQAYTYLAPGAKHVLCRFHHQQGVTRWLKQHFATEAEVDARKPAMKQLFQTREKRTVRRRLARLKERAAEWGDDPMGQRGGG